MSDKEIKDRTRSWIASMVVGLNLCPFARRVIDSDLVRFAVTQATTDEELLEVLEVELDFLAKTSIEEVETTLIIHPAVLQDFFDYNDFLDLAEKKLTDGGYEGEIQLASFHPRYQFAETDSESPENYTNRSPFPMLHLLREQSISNLSLAPNDLLEIPKRNIDTLRKLGLPEILKKVSIS